MSSAAKVRMNILVFLLLGFALSLSLIFWLNRQEETTQTIDVFYEEELQVARVELDVFFEDGTSAHFMEPAKGNSVFFSTRGWKPWHMLVVKLCDESDTAITAETVQYTNSHTVLIEFSVSGVKLEYQGLSTEDYKSILRAEAEP